MNGLADRRYLVCGAGSGIGEATAHFLAAQGARVAVADLHRDTADRVAEEIGTSDSYAYDQGDPTSVEEFFDAAAGAGPIHGVAIVAGAHPGKIPLQDVDPELFRRIHGVNALGVLTMLQSATRRLVRDGRSAIVVTSSVAGIRPVAQDAIYASSKAAAQAIVRSAALEYAAEGIRINSVLPGSVLTPLAISQSSEAQIQEVAARTLPIRRPSASQEIASTIAFLLSDDASSITATELVVDGGLAAAGPK
ncbi:SDR family NAD(P)-dependent oxidoreductase [Pseudactinotalea sp. Z1748]|uniref:SDR family NAD(P)-dependent oxidoreductase n=1 Tax=Pseudactinotalea sp. Z1748 TaxID=3413027 RepID=UPI003C7983FE